VLVPSAPKRPSNGGAVVTTCSPAHADACTSVELCLCCGGSIDFHLSVEVATGASFEMEISSAAAGVNTTSHNRARPTSCRLT